MNVNNQKERFPVRIINIISFAVVLLLPFQAHAEEKSLVAVTLSSTFASKYLAFGSGAVLYDKPVLQSDLFVEFKNGLYVDLWHSTGFDDAWNNNLGDEVDYGVGWNGSIKNFSISLGCTYFDEPNVFTLGGDDILYTKAFISRQYKHVGVTVGYENYTTMPDSGFQGGNLYSAGFNKSIPLIKDRLTLNNSIAAVYDDGGFGYDDGFLLRGNIGLSLTVSKHLTLNVSSVNYYIPLSVHDARKTDAVVFVGFKYLF